MSNSNALRPLFEPGSLTVIGASKDPDKIGNIVVKNLVSGGFKGEIYPVNPGGGEIHGCKVYASLAEIPGEVEGATITLPADQVVEAVRKCSEKGVRFVQIISSGFSEVGNRRAENEIKSIAAGSGMRILGPNVFGIFAASSSMNATFSSTDITHGNIAILTQSGALGIAVIGKAVVDRMGLSAVVSTGNKSDLNESDLLEYLIEDDNTRAILIHLESVKEGERLLATLRRATRKKPVVVLKSGRSERGAVAAAAHIGSPAGSDDVFDAAMKICGVIRARTLEEAFDWTHFLAYCPVPRGERTLILTNGGGVGVIAADDAESHRVSLMDDQRKLSEIFESATPSFGSVKNPVDLTALARSDDYRKAVEGMLGQDAIENAVILYCQTVNFDCENLQDLIRDTHRKMCDAGKPVTFALIGGEPVQEALTVLRRENIPVYPYVDQAVSSIGALLAYRRHLISMDDQFDYIEIDKKTIEEVASRALNEGRNFLLAGECREIMEAAGIPLIESRFCRNLPDVIQAAGDLGYPLAMKVVSRDVHRKRDVGGVVLELDNQEEVIDAFEAIKHNVRLVRSDAVIEGVEVSPMVDTGLEINISAKRDPHFGPVVTSSLGGIISETGGNRSIRNYPLNRNHVRDMLEETGAYPLLLGARWEMRRDIDSLVDLVLKTGAILQASESIVDIEIDPVAVYEKEKGLMVLDVGIVLKKQGEEAL